jgi:hypothetical protein
MRFLGALIIAVSLVIGVVGAITAYLVPLTLADHSLLGLELNAPAGVDPADPSGRTPLARPGQVVTPELLEALRDQDPPVVRIHVKEFSMRRWTGWPLFLLGSVGLIGGAIFLRRSDGSAMLLQTGPVGDAAAGIDRPEGPEASFNPILGGVQKLRRELPTLPPEGKLHAVMEILGEVQRTHVPRFVAARPPLTARLGLAGYAQLMDSFAAAERQINRAWSAAADGVLEEALDRVERAHALLEEAAAKLRP